MIDHSYTEAISLNNLFSNTIISLRKIYDEPCNAPAHNWSRNTADDIIV